MGEKWGKLIFRQTEWVLSIINRSPMATVCNSIDWEPAKDSCCNIQSTPYNTIPLSLTKYDIFYYDYYRLSLLHKDNDEIIPVNWCHYVGKSLHPKNKGKLLTLGYKPLKVCLSASLFCLFSAIQSSIIQLFPLLTEHSGIIESKTCFSKND